MSKNKTVKPSYFIPESFGGSAAFEAEWQPVEERLRQILPLTDITGAVVGYETLVAHIDFSKVADCLRGEPDKTDLVARFLAEVEKKSPRNRDMTVKDLLARPTAELTRWRRMGNRLTLLPNALVLHINAANAA